MCLSCVSAVIGGPADSAMEGGALEGGAVTQQRGRGEGPVVCLLKLSDCLHSNLSESIGMLAANILPSRRQSVGSARRRSHALVNV
ncbi:hypothetical protein ATANTOWER_018833 [Ataeniobius toweri]|uniref:Secreted protein n=1 Tax=Ataeniobius toweri TaxID=208326 RepID=A0ABU7AYK9_9TELE|nr:hypothetical protein [Ataeniobius toweri]